MYHLTAHDPGTGRKFAASASSAIQVEFLLSSLRAECPDYVVTVENSKAGIVHSFRPSEKFNANAI